MQTPDHLRRIRFWLAIFIVGLILSGMTAFPLQTELGWLVSLLHSSALQETAQSTGLLPWIERVNDALHNTNAHYPAADTIHLILDNLSTHTRKALVDRFGEAEGEWLWERFTVHSTPQPGSWLDQAEIAIGIFSRQCLGKRGIGDMATLRIQAKAWNRRINREKITIKWKFTKKQARLKLNYLFKRSRC